MKQIIFRIPLASMIACCVFAVTLSSVSCRKEAMLSPSGMDENYFVVKDNPNDPVDHAIYEFYDHTGIACFYNDTIHQERISDSAGFPRYSYITLSLSYTLFTNQSIFFKPLEDRDKVSSLLPLLEQELLPRLPDDFRVPNFFLVDSIWTDPNSPEDSIELSDGWTSWQGFNTIAISVKDMEAMTTPERKLYAASLLAGLAAKRLTRDASEVLQKDFYSISRIASNAASDIYSGYPLFFLGVNPSAAAEEFGFFRYFKNSLAVLLNLPNPVGPPTEADDIRAFLTAAFYYSPQEFTGTYSGNTLMIKKFNVVRDMIQKSGFQLPD